MSIKKLSEDIAYISRLDDEPNEVGGMSAAALKAEFDRAGRTIQSYINTVLIPSLEQGGAASIGIEPIGELPGADNVQAALIKIMNAVDGVSLGLIPDASLGTEKLCEGAVTDSKLAAGSVTKDKLANGAVTGEKIMEGSVPGSRLSPNSLTGDRLKAATLNGDRLIDGTILPGKLGKKSVVGENIAPGAISADKLSQGCVDESKLNQTLRSRLNVINCTFFENRWTEIPGGFSQSADCPGVLADTALSGPWINKSGNEAADNAASRALRELCAGYMETQNGTVWARVKRIPEGNLTVFFRRL